MNRLLMLTLLILLIWTPSLLAQKTVILEDFASLSDDRVGSTVLFSGPEELQPGEKSEYVLEIVAAAPPGRRNRPGALSRGAAIFLVPQASLSCGGGIYIFYDDIRVEVMDDRDDSWRPMDENRDEDAEYLKTLPIRALPFGVGVIAGYLLDRGKGKETPFSLSEEQYRNYYKEVSQFWEEKYHKVRIALPVELKGGLEKTQEFGLRLFYTEHSASGQKPGEAFRNDGAPRRRSSEERVIEIQDLFSRLRQ